MKCRSKQQILGAFLIGAMKRSYFTVKAIACYKTKATKCGNSKRKHRNEIEWATGVNVDERTRERVGCCKNNVLNEKLQQFYSVNCKMIKLNEYMRLLQITNQFVPSIVELPLFFAQFIPLASIFA